MSECLWSSELVWQMDLSLPPRLHALGLAVHGDLSHERYKLRGLWCAHLYQYRGAAVIDGREFPIRPGFVSVTPADTELEHIWLHPGSVHISAHFAVVEGDSTILSVPAMQDMGQRAAESYAEMEQAVGVYATQPHRAEAALWRMLWLLTETSRIASAVPALHPAVRQALRLIETRLAEPLSVACLADECALSHNHLTRLFRVQAGDTVAGYIRRRRVERARHLLTRSTLPIKAVAAQVGMPDLHQFNKAVRRTTGLSPRQVREQDRHG